MYDATNLPLTADNARAARNYYGLTQQQAADESGLAAHKIKRFEAGNFIPDTKFLEDLRSFYEGKGYTFADTAAPGAKARATGKVFPAGVLQPATQPGTDQNDEQPAVGKLQQSTVQHIRIDPSLTGDEIGNILDHIEGNEDTVMSLLTKPVGKGLLSTFSDQAEAHHGVVVRLLAENGALLAKLLGRPLPAPAEGAENGKLDVVKTHAGLLAATQATMHQAVKGAKDAHAKRKAAKQPSNLLDAIFG